MSRLQPFGDRLWICEGGDVNFFGFPYPNRMVVVALSNGTSWIWSPIAIDDDLAEEVERAAGPPAHLVSPNKLHWIFLRDWQARYPEARVYASPGLSRRQVVANVRFDVQLTTTPDPAYADEIDQVIFASKTFDEVVFFHKPSSTVMVADLIQRFPPRPGVVGWIMRADGSVGEHGTAPAELRLLFWLRGQLPSARRALDTVLYQWQPERLVIAHGQCAASQAVEVIADAFRWVPERPASGPCQCCGGSGRKQD